MAFERPGLRFGIGEWMIPLMDGIKNVDVYELNKIYDYGDFKVSIGRLYHDTPNCFFRIFKGDHKIFRATDTSHLIGIDAKNYSIYMLEMNYSEEVINERIAEKKKTGAFCYEVGASNSHLSEEQAKEWLFKNMNENSKVIRLHESQNNL